MVKQTFGDYSCGRIQSKITKCEQEEVNSMMKQTFGDYSCGRIGSEQYGETDLWGL